MSGRRRHGADSPYNGRRRYRYFSRRLAWGGVGRNEPLADPDGSDYRQNPTARRRNRLRSDKTGSSSPDRRSGRTHLFQRRTGGRDSALAAHAWHQTFQRLTDGRREQAAASRRDRSNPGATPAHAGGNG